MNDLKMFKVPVYREVACRLIKAYGPRDAIKKAVMGMGETTEIWDTEEFFGVPILMIPLNTPVPRETKGKKEAL